MIQTMPTQESFLFSPFLFVPFLLLVLVILSVLVKTVLDKSKVDEPFDSDTKRSFGIKFKRITPKSALVVLVIISIVIVSSIAYIGQIPVHRTNIEHSDPLGDVSDDRIDITSIESFINGTNLYLEMTVAGSIVESSDILYQYTMTIVTKEESGDPTDVTTFRVQYENGTVSGLATFALINGSIITFIISISEITAPKYMVGLEGKAQTPGLVDTTLPDRDGEIAHLL